MTAPFVSVGEWDSTGVDEFGVAWFTENVDGWDDAVAPRVDFPDLPGAAGAFDQGGFDGVRVLTIEGAAIAPDPVSAALAKKRLRALGRNLNTGLDIVGHLPDGDFLVHGKRSAQWPVTFLNPTTFRYQAVITCPDPRLYSAVLHSVSANLTDRSGGAGGPFRFPASFPMGFRGPSAGANQMVVTNDGSADTWPLIVVNGPAMGQALNLRISDQASGSQLIVSVLNAGEFLVLDSRPGKRGVLLMGYQPRRDLLAAGSEWFPIPAESTDVLTFSADAFTTANVTVSWRDAD